MSVSAHCAACGRELLLAQLTNPVEGFRCPFCGVPLAPSYGTFAPGVVARLLAAHAELVASLGHLRGMAGERLLLDRATLVGPVEEHLVHNPRAGQAVADRPLERPAPAG
jgi:hypothetical protein